MAPAWDGSMKRYFLFRGLLSRVYLPILVLFMVSHDLSLGAIASVIAIGQITSFLCEIPSGAIADTMGHRKTLVISLFGQAISSLLFLPGSYVWIVTATVFYNVSASLMSGTSEALFFEYVKSLGRESDHLRLWGQGKAFSRFFNMTAVFLGGVTYGIHPTIPFILCSLQFLVAGILIRTFPKPTRHVSVEEREGFSSLLQHFPRALRLIANNHQIFWLMILNALLMGAITGTNDFQQLIFSNLGATATFIGGVYTLKRFVSMMANGFIYRLSRVKPMIVMTGLLSLFLTYLFLTPFVHSFVVYGALVLLASVVYGVLEVVINDWVNQAIPSLSRATTLSVGNFFMSVVAILSALLFGFIGGDPAWTYPVLGVLILVLSIVPLARMGSGVLAKE